MFLEVIDPSTLLPVERGGAGEIVITNFHRQLMPIIRYRTGERGRIIPRPADGGPRILTFEHLGKL
jgi:phenylacetate-coenzyme A ligase PaaK-like adenylate-forming protein